MGLWPRLAHFSCVSHPRAGGGCRGGGGGGGGEESLQNWEEEASTLPAGTLKPPRCGPADPAKDCEQTKPDTRDAAGGVRFLKVDAGPT